MAGRLENKVAIVTGAASRDEASVTGKQSRFFSPAKARALSSSTDHRSAPMDCARRLSTKAAWRSLSRET